MVPYGAHERGFRTLPPVSDAWCAVSWYLECWSARNARTEGQKRRQMSAKTPAVRRVPVAAHGDHQQTGHGLAGDSAWR